MQDLLQLIGDAVVACLESLPSEDLARLLEHHDEALVPLMTSVARGLLEETADGDLDESSVELAVLATLMPRGLTRSIYSTPRKAAVQYGLLLQATRSGAPAREVAAWKVSDPGVGGPELETAAQASQLRKLALDRYAAQYPDDSDWVAELRKDPLLTATCALAQALFPESQESALQFAMTLPEAEREMPPPDLGSPTPETRNFSRRHRSQELVQRASLLHRLDGLLANLSGSMPAHQLEYFLEVLEKLLYKAQISSAGPNRGPRRDYEMRNGNRRLESDPFAWHAGQIQLLEESAIRYGVIEQPDRGARSRMVETTWLLHPDLRISRRHVQPAGKDAGVWSGPTYRGPPSNVELMDVAVELDSLLSHCFGHIVDCIASATATPPRGVELLLRGWMSGGHADDLDGEEVFSLLVPILRGLRRQAVPNHEPPSAAGLELAREITSIRRQHLSPSLIVILSPQSPEEILGLLLPPLWTDRQVASEKIVGYLRGSGVSEIQSTIFGHAITLAPAQYILRSASRLGVRPDRIWSGPGPVESYSTLASRADADVDYVGRMLREPRRVPALLRPVMASLPGPPFRAQL